MQSQPTQFKYPLAHQFFQFKPITIRIDICSSLPITHSDYNFPAHLDFNNSNVQPQQFLQPTLNYQDPAHSSLHKEDPEDKAMSPNVNNNVQQREAICNSTRHLHSVKTEATTSLPSTIPTPIPVNFKLQIHRKAMGQAEKQQPGSALLSFGFFFKRPYTQ